LNSNARACSRGYVRWRSCWPRNNDKRTNCSNACKCSNSVSRCSVIDKSMAREQQLVRHRACICPWRVQPIDTSPLVSALLHRGRRADGGSACCGSCGTIVRENSGSCAGKAKQKRIATFVQAIIYRGVIIVHPAREPSDCCQWQQWWQCWCQQQQRQ
jgi:hypothetical protein